MTRDADDDDGTPTTRISMDRNGFNPTTAACARTRGGSDGGERDEEDVSEEDEDDDDVQTLEKKLATLRRNHGAEVVEDAHRNTETGRRLTGG